jgi:hypothetical protein
MLHKWGRERRRERSMGSGLRGEISTLPRYLEILDLVREREQGLGKLGVEQFLLYHVQVAVCGKSSTSHAICDLAWMRNHFR